MIKVLFVCSGNICRSPMADGVFQDMVKKAGLSSKILVDSAGTGSWHVGERAHPGTLKVLKNHSIDYRGRSRQIRTTDFNDFDYILAMDHSNLASIQRYSNQDSGPEIAMFLQYAKDKNMVDVIEVPDPYYNGRFDRVYELVEKGSQALLDAIREKHNL